MKSVAKLIQEMQIVFNAFIRERDKGLPCISCSNQHPTDCGHLFKKSIRPAMRFDERAAHLQCRECNSRHDGNYEAMLKGIGERYGAEFLVDVIQEANNSRKTSHKWSRTELEDMIAFYKNELKNLRT